MTIYSEHYKPNETPQSEQADAAQVKNSAGGFSFALDGWARLDRFLILGAEGGSYYASEKKLVRENAKAVQACLREDGPRTVERIAQISDAGRAPKNSPAIFALALASASPDAPTRKAAMRAIGRVCRTGTHLFEFVDTVRQFRGWSRGLRNAVGRWYTDRPADQLAYQLAKYQRRGSWSHRDILRLAHVTAADRATQAALRYVMAGPDGLGPREVKPSQTGLGLARSYGAMDPDAVPKLLSACEALRRLDRSEWGTACSMIVEHGLTHEMVPTEFLARPEVWEALLQRMPLTAMIRNLGRMTANGLLTPLSAAVQRVTERLGDTDYLRKSRVHPLTILVALRTYQRGRGLRGSLYWSCVPAIVDALDGAFYAAFDHVVPTGKRTLLALDVSGSMASGSVAGSPLTPRDASAALALVTARTEPNHHIVGFAAGSSQYGGQWGASACKIVDVPITSRMRLSDAIDAMSRIPMGGTDCALPMLWAQEQEIDVDFFSVFTDSETWFGTVHPHEALRNYRRARSVPARLAVVGMVSNGFTIADPADAGMLDVVGFDTATPALLSAFAQGEV